MSKQDNYYQHFLANLQLNISVASFSTVPINWARFDDKPEFNRLYFIESGEGWVKVGSKDYYPSAGQLMIIPAGLPLSYSTVSNHTFTKYWCHFTALLGSLNLFQVLEVPLLIETVDTKLIETQFKKLILNANGNKLTSALRAKSLLTEIICYYIENSMSNSIDLIFSSPLTSIKKITKVLTYIERNLFNNITVEELAELVHFHPNYFIRFFKDILGVSPISYINQLRIEKAKQMLISTDCTISEIAEAIGLDIYYFSRMFKQFTGFTPSEFRKLVRKNENKD